MTASQGEGDDRTAPDHPEVSPSRRIDGMIDLIAPKRGRSAWVIAGSVVSCILAFATVWPLLTRDPVLIPEPVNPAREARLKAMECRDAASRYLNSNGVEKAAGQFRCAADNFGRAIAEGDRRSKVFLARLYGDTDAQHFLGKYSPQEYRAKAGHLWCEAKAEGEPIAQGPPPFETDVTC